MKICNLASGSEGNVTYVETDNHKILLDLGMTVKYIKEKLSELISHIRAKVPGIILRTTLITGFPSEKLLQLEEPPVPDCPLL